jgi:hypothetical protein
VNEVKKPILKEIIALIGALIFITWLPFGVGFCSANNNSPIVQGITTLPIIHEITIIFGQPHDVLLTVSIALICLLTAFVWVAKKQSR